MMFTLFKNDRVKILTLVSEFSSPFIVRPSTDNIALGYNSAVGGMYILKLHLNWWSAIGGNTELYSNLIFLEKDKKKKKNNNISTVRAHSLIAD